MPASGFPSKFLLGSCAASLSLISGMMWVEENRAKTREELPSSPAVAIAVERIECNRYDIGVFRGSERVGLPRFTELLVAKGTRNAPNLETLVDRPVALVRVARNPNEWEVHANPVWRVDVLTLPENIFKVKEVLPSSLKTPIVVQVDGKTYHLKPGQVLFFLG